MYVCMHMALRRFPYMHACMHPSIHPSIHPSSLSSIHTDRHRRIDRHTDTQTHRHIHTDISMYIYICIYTNYIYIYFNSFCIGVVPVCDGEALMHFAAFTPRKHGPQSSRGPSEPGKSGGCRASSWTGAKTFTSSFNIWQICQV